MPAQAAREAKAPRFPSSRSLATDDGVAECGVAECGVESESSRSAQVEVHPSRAWPSACSSLLTVALGRKGGARRRFGNDLTMTRTPSDYDIDPERYRTGMRLAARYAIQSASVHDLVAQQLGSSPVRRVLDVGCAEGALRHVVGARVVSLDRSLTLLSRVPGPTVAGDAGALPFRDQTFDAAVAVNVLDHLDDPTTALGEIRRVLRRGGTFLAGTISRRDSPELAEVWLPSPTTFDSENAPRLVAGVFAEVDVLPWDAPLITLPDQEAVRDYLIVRFVPAGEAERVAATVPTPITVTKRGALIRAR